MIIRDAIAMAALLWAAPLAAQDGGVVPFDSAYPPLSFMQDGEADGFDVAIARALAAEIDMPVTFVSANFDDIQLGDWPVDWVFSVSSMSINSTRIENFNFVGPYYYDTAVFVRQISETPFQQSDLAGAQVGICSGCNYEAYLQGNYETSNPEPQNSYADVEIVKLATDTDILSRLVNSGTDDEAETLDFGVTSALVADHFVNQGFPIEKVGRPIYVQPVWIVVPKDNEELTDALIAAHLALAEVGAISELSVTYLGQDYFDLSKLANQ